MARVASSFFVVILSVILGVTACTTPQITDLGSEGHRLIPNRPNFDSIAYTDQNYDFDGGLSALDDLLTDSSLNSICGEDRILIPDSPTSPLPTTVSGIATSQSNLYYKVTFDTDGSRVDEKNYGSFFIQDQNEGMFVLRQSDDLPYADFGFRMELNVTGLVMRCGQKMIYSHTLVSRDETPCVDGESNPIRCPIYYRIPIEPFTLEDVNEVYQVEGTVVIPDQEQFDRYGDFAIQTTGGLNFLAAMSLDLKDRQFRLPALSRVRLTAPVISSFGLKLNFDHEGQIEILEGL